VFCVVEDKGGRSLFGPAGVAGGVLPTVINPAAYGLPVRFSLLAVASLRPPSRSHGPTFSLFGVIFPSPHCRLRG